MTDRNEAGAERAQNRPGQPNPEDVFEQGRLEAHRQAVEEFAALARAHTRSSRASGPSTVSRALIRMTTGSSCWRSTSKRSPRASCLSAFRLTRQAVSTIRLS